MKPVEQFLAEYFAERNAFHRKYHDIASLSEQCEEHIESVSNFGSFAIAVTRPHPGLNLKIRYRLRPTGDSWVIERFSSSCAPCGGTGKKPNTDEACPKCEGSGWNGVDPGWSSRT